jgi:hypothetical protein
MMTASMRIAGLFNFQLWHVKFRLRNSASPKPANIPARTSLEILFAPAELSLVVPEEYQVANE